MIEMSDSDATTYPGDAACSSAAAATSTPTGSASWTTRSPCRRCAGTCRWSPARTGSATDLGGGPDPDEGGGGRLPALPDRPGLALQDDSRRTCRACRGQDGVDAAPGRHARRAADQHLGRHDARASPSTASTRTWPGSWRCISTWTSRSLPTGSGSSTSCPPFKGAWTSRPSMSRAPTGATSRSATRYARAGAADVPFQYTSPAIVTAKSKLGEALVACVQYYNAHPDAAGLGAVRPRPPEAERRRRARAAQEGPVLSTVSLKPAARRDRSRAAANVAAGSRCSTGSRRICLSRPSADLPGVRPAGRSSRACCSRSTPPTGPRATSSSASATSGS